MEDSRFDLSIKRTDAERIEMVSFLDCPLSVLEIVAKYDTEKDVLLAASVNPNITDELLGIILERTNITTDEYTQYIKNLKSNTIKKTFCTVPWNHASTTPSGNLRICCLMLDKFDTNNITKPDGSLVSGNDDINKYRNSTEWKNIRKKFINGIKPEECAECWHKDETGTLSHRDRTMKMYPDLINKALEHTSADGTIDPDVFPIEYWDLRFGNNCNLKCRSCSPVSSNLWYDDFIKIAGKENLVKVTAPNIQISTDESGKDIIIDNYNWYDNSLLWDKMLERLEHVTRFYFTGGEPTINKKHKELLEIIIDRGLADKISLDYNTNVAGLPGYVFDLWPKFKEVNLGMSIDGIFEHFEYIRHPGNWAVTEKLIRRIDTDPRLTNVNAVFSSTISVMNILHVLDMQWWVKEQNWSRISHNMVMHPVHMPLHYNIQNLPEDMKFYITSCYNRFIADITRCYGNDDHFVKKLKAEFLSIADFLNSPSSVDNMWGKFIKITEELDAVRNENWKDSLPEISKLYDYYRTTENKSPVIKIQSK